VLTFLDKTAGPLNADGPLCAAQPAQSIATPLILGRRDAKPVPKPCAKSPPLQVSTRVEKDMDYSARGVPACSVEGPGQVAVRGLVGLTWIRYQRLSLRCPYAHSPSPTEARRCRLCGSSSRSETIWTRQKEHRRA